jgi:hypothetical protein
MLQIQAISFALGEPVSGMLPGRFGNQVACLVIGENVFAVLVRYLYHQQLTKRPVSSCHQPDRSS